MITYLALSSRSLISFTISLFPPSFMQIFPFLSYPPHFQKHSFQQAEQVFKTAPQFRPFPFLHQCACSTEHQHYGETECVMLGVLNRAM